MPTPHLTWRNPVLEVVDGVLTPAECLEWIRRIDAEGPTAAPVSTSHGDVYRPDYRHNERVMFDDEAAAAGLFERVRGKFPERFGDWVAVGANERLRCYRYREGHFFAPHFDGSFQRRNGDTSLLTFIVYLNGDFAGGDTHFPDLERSVVPMPGRAVLFNHHLLHESVSVRRGTKYAVRSDILYRESRGARSDC